MTLNGPVLAGLDMSDDDETLRQADALARALDTRLVVCRVLPDLAQVRVLFPQDAGPLPAADTIADGARAAITERVTRVTGRPPAADAVVIEAGSPHAGLRRAAEALGAGVIVVGPGRTAKRLAHHPAWAVLVARRSPGGGAVIGATDFSDPALPALTVAAAESRRRQAPLTFMHAVDFDTSGVAMTWPAVVTWPTVDPTQALVESARGHLADSLSRLGVKGQALVMRGPAATAIVGAATSEGAALLVVGTRGRSALPRLLLGSVAETVMRDAPCSVLAVPLHTETPPAAAA